MAIYCNTLKGNTQYSNDPYCCILRRYQNFTFGIATVLQIQTGSYSVFHSTSNMMAGANTAVYK